MEKEKILIVDDSEMNRSILADMLGDEYDIIEAEDGVEGLSIMQGMLSQLSLVLLDIVMPKLDGFGVLEAMKEKGWIQEVPVIIISAENTSTQVERAYMLGAVDYIARPFDTMIVQRRVINTLLLYAKQKQLIQMVEEQIREKEKYSDLMIDILSHIVEFRNGESGLHIIHVRILTELLLRYMLQKTDKYRITEENIPVISTASALHDIGKIAIDEHILNKPGRLTKEEFEVMKTHSSIGAEMLSNLPIYKDEQLVKIAYEICRWHHERFDGRGYPDGLRGDDIPISAQVVALADVYDALTSERVYKPPFSHDKAVEMITAGECGAFNPLLLECLAENAGRIRSALKGDHASLTSGRKAPDVAGEMTRRIGGNASDRTLQLLDKERLRNSFYASITESILFDYTDHPPVLSFSEWGTKKLGLKENIANPAQDKSLSAVLGEGVWERLEKRFRNTTPENPQIREECVLTYNGVSRWHRIIAQTLWYNDGEPHYEGALGIIMDIHEAYLKMEELARRASRDPLTGLLNRSSAREHIEIRIQEHPHGSFALVIFDVDHFKTANDTYGHQFGDELLKHTAQSLQNSIRSTDIACRAGGDEFLVFLEYRTDIEKAIDRIFHNLCQQVLGFQLSVSMGVVLGSDVGLSYCDMFSAADTALYAAKQAGKHRYCFYDKETMKDTLKDAYRAVSDIVPE